MNQDVQVLETAAEEVAVNPGLTATQKGLIIGAAVLTGGLVVGGLFLFRHLKAKKSAKQPAKEADAKAESHE